jgi:hypothetical protein
MRWLATLVVVVVGVVASLAPTASYGYDGLSQRVAASHDVALAANTTTTSPTNTAGGQRTTTGLPRSSTASIRDFHAAEPATRRGARLRQRLGDERGGSSGDDLYHRYEPENAQAIADSGELFGTAGRYGVEPAVRAYRRPIPKGRKGIEFLTDAQPSSPFGPIAFFRPGSRGVTRVGDRARICVTVTKVQC